MEAQGTVNKQRSWVGELFSFPHPANDVAARMVAGMVVTLGLASILLDLPWLLAPMVYEFVARVLTGPKLSVMGLLATRVLVPLLGNPSRPVAGPPKRFAQAMGVGFSAAALVLHFGLGLPVAATGALGVLLVFASLEAALGFCAGCFAFGYLMRWGLVPQETCEKCNSLDFSRSRAEGAGTHGG